LENKRRFEETNTERLEAFSDGIFAFAATLLVLGLYDPTTRGISDLAQGLLQEWPSFFALATSFLTILVMWMNHHNMFLYIERIDRRFMFQNGLLLLFVTIIPFTTMLVSEHLLGINAITAGALYAGIFLALSIVWNNLWHFAVDDFRLVSKGISASQLKKIKRDYYVAPAMYGTAFVVAFISPIASIVIIILPQFSLA
jgi:uncharacterized membrane protein